MAIKLKRSAVASKAPLTSDLDLGELAVNTYDGKLFLKKDNGTAAIVEIGPVQSVAGKTGVVTLAKADVGLGAVDNTSDANKPVSTAMQTALSGKAATTHGHAIADVVSLQAALDGKAASAHAHVAADVAGLGTAATLNVGAAAGNVVQLDASARLPAVSGALLTNLSTGQLTETINAQSASYTLALADKGDLVTINAASANTLTVPPNASVAFGVGTSIDVAQLGAGQSTIAPGSGVTINATPGLKLRAQYSGATLIKIATDTWLAFGDLSA